ncbi:MAG: hypothetical protein OEN01_06800, partial [Candidatus Krumholzibacteria bacterium]|nr:hypothetical protein [Candidatus Krumholzibacteria bacterium]
SFRAFDYTQKAEYWAVVWGTWIMALTGLVLWYPTVATSYLPAWTVRVSEVIHFYEAVLAVSAIFIWHFFYVIFMPGEYPMSTTWLNGRMPAGEWKETHAGEYFDEGEGAIRFPSQNGKKTTAMPRETSDGSGAPHASPHPPPSEAQEKPSTSAPVVERSDSQPRPAVEGSDDKTPR